MVCENHDIAVREFGHEIADRLIIRLADLSAVKNVSMIFSGNPQKQNTEQPSYTVDLHDAVKIHFTVAHPKIPRDENGDINWNIVSYIRITQIGTL